MKIAITGGSGFVGSHLVKKLAGEGHEILMLGRHPLKEKVVNVSFIQTDLIHDIPLKEYLACEAVIHLAGANVFGWWTKRYKKQIRDSRVETARALITAVKKAGGGPKIFVSASAIGYYGEGGESELTESSPKGNDFMAHVCDEWEGVVATAEKAGMRWVCVRTGIVLGKEGGILQKLVSLYKYGLGATIGKGTQWLSWIYIEDLVNVYKTVLFDSHFGGVVNATAPYPVRNKEFVCMLGEALHRPVVFSIPGFVLKMVLGEFGATVLVSQKVIPKKLLDQHFAFIAATLENVIFGSTRKPRD